MRHEVAHLIFLFLKNNTTRWNRIPVYGINDAKISQKCYDIWQILDLDCIVNMSLGKKKLNN